MDLDILMILILMIVSVFLVVVEVLLIPGVSVAIIGSIISGCVAIGISYTTFGTAISILVFLATLILSMTALFICLKKKNLSKLALKNNITSTVGDKVENSVKKGEFGISTTRLAPIGHVNINDKNYEAKSVSGLIDPKTDIEVIGYEDNLLVVKKIEL